MGLTDGIVEFADRIRKAGHPVDLPDLYGGITFGTLEDGLAHVEKLGFESFLAASEGAAESGPRQVVYAGFSLGALAAHRLAQTRPGALGALLYHHGDVPIETFGSTWPAEVDIQIHVNAHDEFYEADVVAEFIDSVSRNAQAELFTYPGSTHLFTDSSLRDHEPESAALVEQRTVAFLDRHR